jgi:putative cardiolipin synthase
MVNAPADIPPGKLQVIRWSHSLLPGYGMHRKIFLVDHENANEEGPSPGCGPDDAATAEHGAFITGGMNYGDEYSHENPEPRPGRTLEQDRWLDTDIIVYGAATIRQAAHSFASIWNNYVADGGTLRGDNSPRFPSSGQDPRFPDSPKLTLVEDPGADPTGRPPREGADMVAVIDQTPSLIAKQNDYLDPVYLATLKMIRLAKREINLSNAYYIATPPIQEALIDAIKKNHVTVRLHTNGADSVDDPSLLRPIRRGFEPLMQAAIDAGNPDLAQVYERLGSTLHSKYMVIDGRFGWVGSYNLHPRSFRYENEMVLAFDGDGIGKAVTSVFENDISLVPIAGRAKAEAVRVKLENVRLKRDTRTDTIEFLFFDLL